MTNDTLETDSLTPLLTGAAIEETSMPRSELGKPSQVLCDGSKCKLIMRRLDLIGVNSQAARDDRSVDFAMFVRSSYPQQAMSASSTVH
jgi:hypothetical protein